MAEKLKENWFVVLIALLITAFVIYFVYDSTKYNVSSKTVDGKEVLASIDGKDITAEDLYEEASAFDASLLYNLYRNAIVEQTIETDDELKEEAKNLESSIRAQSSSMEDFESNITSELANYGYKSYDDLDDYCLMSVKEKKMNSLYVDEHFDELIEPLKEKDPRTISIITMAVIDPNSLTGTETKKRDSIEKSIEKDGFGKAAESFSEDTTTAANQGLYGYIDKDNASSSNSGLDLSVIDAALALQTGETSDWIQVQDQTSGSYYLYKVHVNETDVQKIHESKNKDIKDQLLYAILNSNTGLRTTILEENGKNLDIEISNTIKEKLNNYIEEQKGGN